MKFVIAAACAALLLGTALPVRAATADFAYDGALSSAQRLDVRDVNGNITVTTGSGLHVRAHKTAERGDPNDVTVLVRPSSSGVVVCVRYPGDSRTSCDNDGAHAHDTHDNDTRVDLTITIPPGAELRATTVNGNIDAHVDGVARGITVNGNVKLDARDVTSATTVNGAIAVRLRDPHAASRLRLATVNGAVDLTMPAGVGATVDAKVLNGGITGLGDVQRPQFGPGASAKAVFGSGARRISLATLNGTVTVTRS
jgi:DUF4097 and DUF4098 domain-containing protein YvlB